MPHASFRLRDKGHFSKRNIRSLFLVVILRTACHNAFTFCPYIWICHPSCAFAEGMRTLFSNFSEAAGRWLQPAAHRGRRSHAPSAATTGPRPTCSFSRAWAAGEQLFSSRPASLPSQPALQPIKANCQTSVDGGTASALAFPSRFFLLSLVASGKRQKLLFA